MSANEKPKPLVNVLLETVAKRHNIDLHLKNYSLASLDYLNQAFLYDLVQSTESVVVSDVYEGSLLGILTRNLMRFLPYDKGHSIYFPNLRPVNHFEEGEEVYALVSDFSSAKQGDYKELGFIRTVIEHKEKSSQFLKLKTFDDLPDGHHLSVGNSSGHAATNFGKLLKINEFKALTDRSKTSLEFLDLFRANSVGQFQNLELYDVSKYQKSDTPPTFDLGTALIPKVLYAGNFKDT